MGNKGSSIASTASINVLETIWLLRESRQYIYDEEANKWIPVKAEPGITTLARDYDNDVVELDSTPKPLGRGEIVAVLIKAEGTNSADAYIGKPNKATSDKGFPLCPGEAVVLKTDNLSKIYVSGAEGDRIRYIAVLK